MRKYRTRIPDYDYYRELVSCQFSCPVHTDASGYVNAIAAGDYERAYRIARESNPLASVCGRVCGAPCEAACRRGQVGEAVSIRALKRFITEQYGSETGSADGKPIQTPELQGGVSTHLAPSFGIGPQGSTSFRDRSALRALPRRSKVGRVAVVGSGPSGLSAAHDLAVMGHKVTLFEAQSVAGGMLVVGIPEYRLSRKLVKAEIQAILDLGVELKLNQKLGQDFDLSELRRQGYDAVFLAIGAHASRSLRIEGVENDGVLQAVDFLLNVNMGYKVELGQRVLVIGGGSVAVDVARSALRKTPPVHELGVEELRAELEEAQKALQQVAQVPESQPDAVKMAMDVARSALRLGVKEISMACLEAPHEMPADPIEVEEASEEGIQIHNSLGPKRILGKDGKVTGVEFLDVASVFDSTGRFNPTFNPGTESVLEADTVILAIGQASDLSFIREGDGIEPTPRGTLQVDADTLATTAPGVFAGGDVAFGPRLIIHAVADGQKAARSIDAYLGGQTIKVQRRGRMTPLPAHRPHEVFLSQQREKVPALDLERRVGIAQVELGYDVPMAEQQAARCLQCSVNPVFNGELCIQCGGCVDICPENCLKLVPVEQLEGGEELSALLHAQSGDSDAVLSAMLKDEQSCIRCGLCAQRCPTHAVTMEIFQFHEQLTYATGGQLEAT
jgi:NADPH-dependent glutamate synthase beta subunit-like oxidoreductase